MAKVTEGMEKKDWTQLKMGAHQLKGASGYVGAGRIHYCCYWIQKAHTANDPVKIVSYY